MQFPMLFERFLDPTRTDPPDIDIDFEDERRDEVFTYAATKYGSDRVANIATFTRYLGRKSLDDVARVYHVPAWKVSAIKDKLLDRPEGHPRFSNSLEDTRDTFNEVAEILKETPELGYSILLEGDIREFSVHAAGMVVSSVPMHEICATYEREINGLVRQAIPYDKRDAAYLNLLKIDMLSLITMGKIAKVCKLAGLKLEDLYRIPLDDKETPNSCT
jgi:DNA polymerase-3 subunit alpha